MAASASLSSPFSLKSPHRFSAYSSGSTRFASLRHNQQHLIISGNNNSRTAFSSFPLLNSYAKDGGISIIMEHNNRRGSLLKHFVSAQQEPQPYQGGAETGDKSEFSVIERSEGIMEDYQMNHYQCSNSLLGNRDGIRYNRLLDEMVNDEDRSDSNDFQANKRRLSSLKSLMHAYKEAILYEDEKTVYDIEDIIFSMDKENRELAQKISALSAEISSGKEKYIRLQADFENYRKRSEKERITIRSNAQGEVIESLLPMVDSFERAKQQIIIETEKEKKINTSYQGIYKQLVEIMRSLRVTAVPTVGKQFDPLMHEAIAREESHQFKEGIIIQEFRRGFYLGDRLLRPAMVKVSSGPGKKKSPSLQERATEQPPSVVGVENH